MLREISEATGCFIIEMMNRLFKIEIIRSLVDVGVKANDHQNMEMIITAAVDDDAQKSALCVCVW